MNTTYDVRLWAIREHKGKDRTTGKARSTYRVRWLVAGEEFGETFQTRALAESFRAKLITAQREGVAFDVASGLPEPMARELNSRSWLEHAIAYVDMKWPGSSAHHRKGIAETLTGATMALLSSTGRSPVPDATLRRALGTYLFVKPRRDAGPPPDGLATAVAWLHKNTVKIAALEEAALVRKVLDALALKLDGTAAGASTVARKRAVFSGTLRHALEEGHLNSHPMKRVKWIAPKKDDAIDRRQVANPDQADRVLAAVRTKWPELAAMYESMYRAGLRPEEALGLLKHQYERPKVEGEWGWLHLGGATTEVGTAWTDDGKVHEHRPLKHRSKDTVRPVPAEPALCRALDWHIENFPPGLDGRLFVTRRGPGGKYKPTRGQPVTANARSNAWRAAREAALTPDELAAGIAPDPYSLRHACVSTQLNAGVSPTLVAEWAGHSIAVLFKIYAKCLYGEEKEAFRRMDAFRAGQAATLRAA
ncbi:tyrosine-type recombinase/integrase [Actinoplanes sp. NPDC051494]|uniref:tyrosine-type recombinase/integrase n=1 Tax=Actinoplanes sp. NPDC051494 TaxID=3363907 RepID=UPI003794FDC1